MTKQEFAKLINVSPRTLYNWEKEKPELIKLINLGLLSQTIIDKHKSNIDSIEKFTNQETTGKLILKDANEKT